MGGIVGFFCRGGLSLPDRAQFVRQTELLTARGPDDDGSISIDPPYGLGSRRPLAEGITHQPLWDGERRVGVVLDGGFDNIQALRTMLRDRGHRTSLIDSASVLLAAYREWGDRCVDHLSGDFALAVVDRRAKVVLLAREALGRCPLYYYWDRDYFCFASEVQALLGDSAVSRVLEPNAVYRWFACGWCEPDSCLLQGVHTVGPGEALVVDAERIRVRRYWTLGEVTTGHDGGALRQLRDELRHAALRHSSAIVALSGGRISSFLAVLRKQQLGQARSFSLPGFNLEDRRECVRLTSEFDLANSEIGAADPRGVLEAALNSMDLPIGSLSYLGHVAWAEALRLAKRTEPVVTGIGAKPADLNLSYAGGSSAATALTKEFVWGLRSTWSQPTTLLSGWDPLLETLSPDTSSTKPVQAGALAKDTQVVDRLRTLVGCPVIPIFLQPHLYELMVAKRTQGEGVWERVVRGTLPMRVVLRQPSISVPPLGHWMRGSASGSMEELLFSRPNGYSGVLNTRRLRRWWYEHQLGLVDLSTSLWRVAVFEYWYRRVVVGERPYLLRRQRKRRATTFFM